MAAKKKRIGLVLASIHNGLSLKILDSFVRTATVENTSLFIFPGGRLDARRDYENLRNSVYYLVNDKNLDGCISWSSTIRYTHSKEEFEHFHANFDPLPYVTLGFKLPGHPCVEFDAYNGMKALVGHCISVHGARRIAFLRGPDFHQSAGSRLEGYYDALKEAGLSAGSLGKKNGASQSPLVTSPFNWGEGAAAAAQIFEERSLIPGRDFDTLVGSSDLMVLGAINYFALHGYHVPGDYRAVGFNNSEESRVAESPLSTVHVPYTEMSRRSFKILLGIMNRKKLAPDADVLLQSDMIIRESCGCSGFRAAGETPRLEGTRHITGSAEETLARMVRDYLKPDAVGMDTVALPLVRALLYEGPERFLPLFEKSLTGFFNSGRETENLLRLIADAAGLDLPVNIRGLEPSLYRSMFRIHEQLAARARYEKEGWNTVLNSLKCDLLGTRDRNSLIHSLAQYLPKIGISAAAIVLYADEKTSICVGSFSPQGISPQKEQLFPARLLVPASLKPQYEDGIFMVQPLFIENQSLGYFVHNVPIINGVIFEELRSAVSYALKGIALLEETVRAKRIAEQAEKAKTEFLHTLENGLYNPLQGVMDHIEKLEQKAGDITELKKFVLEKEAQAGSLMDFTLSRVDELTLRKTLFEPEELLPGIGTFPLLSGDTARLAQCFSLIREHFSGDDHAAPAGYSAEMGFGGLIITFRGGKRRRKTEEARHFSLLLVERIILMHGGEFSIDNESCTVILPWTTLSGQEPSGKPISPQDHILVLGDPAFLPANFFTLPRVYDTEKAPPGRTAFVAWNACGASTEEMVKVAALQQTSEFAAVPFLCYGGEPGEGTFGVKSSIIDAVEYILKSSPKGAVLFIGSPEPGSAAEQLFPEGGLESIHIDSMAAFNETVSAITPSLVVFNSLNPAGAAAVRQHPLTIMVPIVMIGSRIDKAADVMRLSQYPRLIICHRAVSFSPEFRARVKALIGSRDEILPPHTGVLVKKAILYFDQHAESQISRWKLADSINVSEDYLTRIFHREMGMSLWDYLNRLKVFLAAEFLRQTNRTIQDIAWQTGFNDQAYFCRVFRKIYGVSPKQLRKK
jgi:DNA-binding LacI/PurR family transcriptional regulator/AraC-like DNA-binding protein